MGSARSTWMATATPAGTNTASKVWAWRSRTHLPAPSRVAATMSAMAALRAQSVEATEALEPPQQIADLHRLLLEWENELVPIEEAFADRAAVVSGWPELLESGEVAAYRAALVEGKQRCIEFQATLDATESRGVFSDTPWLPAEFSEVVDARLGCDLFPENPDSVFQPAPPATESSG